MTTKNTISFETRDEFKGFDAHYDKDILPFLQEKETERIARVSKAKRNGILTAVIISALAFILSFKTGNFIIFVIAAGFGALLGWGIAYAMLNKLKGETKQHLMGSICGFLGWEFAAKDFIKPDLTLWRDNHLLPGWDRVNFEDRMSGKHHDHAFTFCEAHLEKRSTDSEGKTTWNTVFRGILLDVDFRRDFLGRTVVLRDAGIFNSKKKAGMKKVGLVDPKFEKIFEAYGTDQVEARYLLTPTFMQKLVDLETSVSGKKARFGFLNGKLHVAVEAPNQFEAGSMFKPLIETARTEKIMKEISAVMDVLSGVNDADSRSRR